MANAFTDLFNTVGTRNLLDIARADDDKFEQELADKFLETFEGVFKYRPDLGEPETDGDYRAFWIQGYLFREFHGHLAVLTTRDTWLDIARPRDLLHNDDWLVKEQYDRFTPAE